MATGITNWVEPMTNKMVSDAEVPIKSFGSMRMETSDDVLPSATKARTGVSSGLRFSVLYDFLGSLG